MLNLLIAILRDLLRPRQDLLLENLALRLIQPETVINEALYYKRQESLAVVARLT